MTQKTFKAIWFSFGLAVGSAASWLLTKRKQNVAAVMTPSPGLMSASSSPLVLPVQAVKTNPGAEFSQALPGLPGSDASGGGLPAASPRWSIPTRYIMGILLFVAALMVLYIGRSAIPMVLTAGLVSVFIQPVVAILQQRLHLKKSSAVTFTYLGVALVLIAIPLLVIPPLIDAVNFILQIDPQQIAEQLSQAIQKVQDGLPEIVGVTPTIRAALDSVQAVINNFAAKVQTQTPVVEVTMTEVSTRLGQALGTLGRVLGPTVSALTTLLFTFLMSLQMSLLTGTGAAWFTELVPPGHGPEMAGLFRAIQRTWTGFLRGQMSLMLIVGMIIWLGGLLLGLPQALLMGVIAGMLELIPSVGPIIAAVPAVLIALIFGSTHLSVTHGVFALIVILFYVIVQLVENQFLVPYIMGDAVDMPPLAVLIGTLAGAGAYGIIGALLATPVIATGYLIFRYVYRKVFEQPPAPEPLSPEPSIWDRLRSFAVQFRRSPAAPAPGALAAGQQVILPPLDPANAAAFHPTLPSHDPGGLLRSETVQDAVQTPGTLA